MYYQRLTSCLNVGCVVQFGEHRSEGLNCLIIALCAMKRYMLQLVSKIRHRVEFNDLGITTMSFSYETMRAFAPSAHREVLPSIAFYITLPYYGLQRQYQTQN
jgi:hypothetical protein